MKEIYTTWNKVAEALQKCSGDYEGFNLTKKDISVCLVPIGKGDFNSDIYPSTDEWYEVKVQTEHGNYDTCYFLPDGSPTNIRDWAPFHSREGVAVPVEVLKFLQD